MAGQIFVDFGLSARNGNFTFPKRNNRLTVVQNNPGGGVPGQITATVAGVDVDTTAIGLGTAGWCRIRNIDDTNYVRFGVKPAATFYPVGRLLPGEIAQFRIEDGISLRLEADTADVIVQIEILED